MNITEPLRDRQGPIVAELHQRLRLAGQKIDPDEENASRYGPSTENAVRAMQERFGMEATGRPDAALVARLEDFCDASPIATRNTISGRILFEYGLPASNIVVRAYSRGFGGSQTRLGADATTDESGNYSLSYAPIGGATNVELRTVDASGNEIPLSNPKYQIGAKVAINLVAPALLRPLSSEFQRLSEDVTRQLGSFEQLGSAQENSERQDLTVLHLATGWDARLLALAAIAIAASRDGLSPEVLYGLFRAGLPTDTSVLARFHSEAVAAALAAAAKAGVVALDERQIAAATSAFKSFALSSLRASKATGAVSTFEDLLDTSALTDSEKTVFADLYFANADDPATLWDKVKSTDISAEKISSLQMHGKLAYLTSNNAPLVASLSADVSGPDDIASLVENDFYKPDAWKTRLGTLSEGDAKSLDALIPPHYVGDQPADRLSAYAADLASRVRLAFPNQVVRRMLDNGEIRIGKNGSDSAAASGFLKKALPLGYALGQTPFDAFVAAQKDQGNDLFTGMNAADAETAKQSVKQLHRLYQITPSNESLQAVLDLGFASAHHIAGIPRDRFLDLYGGNFPSVEEATLVYNKAQQVKATALNVFTTAKLLDTFPMIYGLSGSEGARQTAIRNVIKQYPTMGGP